ncbi:hypothetical protein [Kitasatospora cineracea]|uniref:Uncharacterized protein n=1 Tax=Kitasatospora cineracea TaxID=88074 RepID=A0A3N4R7E0_9ACTN|nr:hypothetical protein [Kitasatospora cineracea]ROR33958.1 hypothetical protein EDD39_7781 [Kitasatospora cineracea]RPE29443.1 hypothetical protein EDD38_6598 [Kitasatospora cineracea]
MPALRKALANHEDALLRLLSIAFRVAAVLLLPWIVDLALNVRGHFGARNLSNAWVWLDLIEAASLLLLAALVRRRHRTTSPIASATAVLLGMDAFFDLWSAHRGEAFRTAELLAYAAELPSAALLAALSWYSLRWAAGLHPVPAPARTRRPAPPTGN